LYIEIYQSKTGIACLTVGRKENLREKDSLRKRNLFQSLKIPVKLPESLFGEHRELNLTL